ncbi:MAG: alpha/beta hydrolase fold domain-containing protein [Prevotella sp.]|nr:alpha/beta hydrolase fold domain-containing protein [Prevotella sp.]
MKKLLTLTFSFLISYFSFSVAQTQRTFTVNISEDGASNMVAYLPEKPTGRAVVCCPGGGYVHLAIDHEGHQWAPWFNEQGIAFFVLTYRMPKGDRTIPMGDAQQAIRTVRDSAAVWAMNPYDVGIMGFSAGGHLASTVSTHSEFDCRPNFSILFYPVISMNEREGHRGSSIGFLGEAGVKDEKLVKEFSNQNAVRSHLTPPAIILTASDDNAVPVLTNAIPYYTAMRKAGNFCSMYIYPSGGHGFGFRDSWPYHNQMLNDLQMWLKSVKSPRQDALRVACIGNSITHGSGIDMQEQRGYPAQLQRLLGDGYYVRNFGVGGRTMLQKGDHPYMIEQAWRDAQAFRPDIVVIKLGTNDSKDYNWNAHKQDFEADMQAMIDTLKPFVPVLNKKGRPTKKMQRAEKPQIFLCSPIKAFRDKWGITDSVIVNEVIPAIQRVAQKNNLQFIDLHPVVTDPKDMTSDMIHPNDKGAGKMAKAVCDAIKSGDTDK